MMRWLLSAMTMFSAVIAAGEKNQQFQFGSFEVTAIRDAPSAMRSELFPGITEAEFRKLAGGKRAPSSVNVFLLKRDSGTILVDTGNGGDRGAMLCRLEQNGIPPEKIDCILLTHMHGDHIGGLLGKDGKAVFPRALVYVSEPERDYWQNAAGPRGELAQKVLKTYGGRIRTFRFGEEVLPGIKALDASGHTPGHTVFKTDSLLIVGDLLHAAAVQVPRPEVSATYDVDPEKAAKTRLRFYELAAESSKAIAGMHLPWPGIGRIERNEAGYVYLPAGETRN